MRGMRATAVGVALAVCTFACAQAAPVTPARIAELCTQAEGPAHCGRLIEAEQLKALPNLANRDGRKLSVLLYPSGTREFVDVDSLHGDITWSLWDYISALNAVVLFTTDGDRLGYAVLQRYTGQVTALPAEPTHSPDRQRFAVADFCREICDNELTVWQISREGVRKELVWKPNAAGSAPWSDVTVQWKDAATLSVEYTANGEDKPRIVERRLTDAQWRRVSGNTAP